MEIKSDLSIIVFIALIASVGSRVPIKTLTSQADLGNKYGSDSSRSKGSHTSSSSSEEDTAGGRTNRHISGGSRFSSSGNSPQHTDEVMPPSWKDRHYKYHISKYDNQSVTFRCPAYGFPEPKVTWFKDGLQFRFRPHGVFIARGSILRMRHLQSWDSGIFKCKVTNALGSIERPFLLQVMQYTPRPPSIRKGYPGNKTISEGDTVIFHCKISGRLIGSFSVWWFRQPAGHRPPEAAYDILKGPVETTSTRTNGAFRLVLMQATSKDAGKYTCMVSNRIGTAYGTGWLFVRHTSRIPASINGRRPFEKDRRGENDIAQSEEIDKSYIQGVVVAVGSSSVILLVAMVLFVVLAIRKVHQRQDTVLQPYNLK